MRPILNPSTSKCKVTKGVVHLRNFLALSPSTSECKVTPCDSEARKDDSWKNHYCLSSSNCKDCGNYEVQQ